MALIVVAEDEPLLREAIAEALAEHGATIMQANDGVEALSLITNNPAADMLISDYKMPRMDGYALAKAVLDTRPGLKILLMSAHGFEIPPPEALDGIRMLHKPFDLRYLADVVDALLPFRNLG